MALLYFLLKLTNREIAKERFRKPTEDYLGRKCQFLDGIGRCGIYLNRPLLKNVFLQ